MPVAVLVAVLFAGPARHGDAVGLAPAPPAAPPAVARSVPTSPPAPAVPAPPGVAVVAIAATAAVAAAAAGGRRRDDPIVVYVPGHGGDPDGFDDLARALGLDDSQVVVFDYRIAIDGVDDAVEASRRAPVDDAADALDGLLTGLGRESPVYVVGHSKGGAVVAEVLARWDGQPGRVPPGVYGAALLDPAIAGGLHGVAQSIGLILGPFPDDGGFDPLRCDLTGCVDRRAHLGEAAGVEVVVIRNPDGAVMSFRDRPEGLRVFDLDDGGGSAWRRLPNLWGVLQRVREAHASVLRSSKVAGCLRAELRYPGSCRWVRQDRGGRLPAGVGRVLPPRLL